MVKREDHAELERDVAQAAKKDAKSSKSNSSGDSKNSKLHPPSSYDAFKSNDGVSMHLVIKDAEGRDITTMALKKKEFGTGSFGWTLSESLKVDNGENGEMAVSFNANCEYRIPPRLA